MICEATLFLSGPKWTLRSVWSTCFFITLLQHHNGPDGVSNHQPHHCLLNSLSRCSSKKTSKLRVTGLCAGNSPGTGEFPAQMASNAENASIWWRHHEAAITTPSHNKGTNSQGGMHPGCMKSECHILCPVLYFIYMFIHIDILNGDDFNRLYIFYPGYCLFPLLVSLILTHWGRNKMAAIFQTTFSNDFLLMKMYEFRLRFHWTLFLEFELTIPHHWFR